MKADLLQLQKDREMKATVNSCFSDEAMEVICEEQGEEEIANNAGGRGRGGEGEGEGGEIDPPVHILKGYGVPKYALVNGHFRGICPPAIARLNRTELTLVNKVNVVSKFILLPKGGHLACHSNTVFSVVNETIRVVEKLGRAPDITDLTLIRHQMAKIPKEFTWSPFAVQDAIRVIQDINFLYKDDKVDEELSERLKMHAEDTRRRINFSASGRVEAQEATTIEVTDEEVKYLGGIKNRTTNDDDDVMRVVR
jgi:hypothetical protein